MAGQASPAVQPHQAPPPARPWVAATRSPGRVPVPERHPHGCYPHGARLTSREASASSPPTRQPRWPDARRRLSRPRGAEAGRSAARSPCSPTQQGRREAPGGGGGGGGVVGGLAMADGADGALW